MKTDKEKIEETIQHFFDAYTNCNSEGLLKAFDKTTLLHHYYPDKSD
ncbi:MAG: hypothetical protein GY756_05190, partial [bacterium]|nr:hypothetical protein [bacterium]